MTKPPGHVSGRLSKYCPRKGENLSGKKKAGALSAGEAEHGV